jgi:hypothetical protein
MQKSRAGLAKGGFNAYGSSLGAEADFEASSAAWDAKNAYATHMAGMAGLNGANPGGMAPGPKPADMRQLAGGGVLGAEVRSASHYGGFGFMSNVDSMLGKNRSKGSQLYMNQWTPWGFGSAMSAAGTTGYLQYGDVARASKGVFNNLADLADSATKGDRLPSYGGVVDAPNLGNVNSGPQMVSTTQFKEVMGKVENFTNNGQQSSSDADKKE